MKKSFFPMLIVASAIFVCPHLRAADRIETFDFQAPPSDVQLPPNYPVPDFAQPDKVDVVATELDNLKERVEALEKKLKSCNCEKRSSN